MGKCHLCQLFDADHDTKSCPWLICKNCGKSGHAVKFCPKLKFKPLNESVISKNSSHLQKCHEVFNRQIFYLMTMLGTTISGILLKLGPMRPFWKLFRCEKYFQSQPAHMGVGPHPIFQLTV